MNVENKDWTDFYDRTGPTYGEPERELPEMWVQFDKMQDVEVRPREWVFNGLIPANTVTLLSGDGGTGKSLLALQLAISVATGGKLKWLGRQPEIGKALYISAEDDHAEVHRRVNDIVYKPKHEVDYGDLENLIVASLTDRDAILSSPDRMGLMQTTPLYNKIKAKIDGENPKIVILDTLADLFGGNENDRSQTRQFIGQLRQLCVEFGTSIVLLSHPSLSGMASGSGTSGNTAWSNSVRSRLYMTRIKDDGYEADKTARKLSVMKANYGETGAEILMHYNDGHFDGVENEGFLDRSGMNAKAERVFLTLLDQYVKMGSTVSDSMSTGKSAVVQFGRDEDREGITKKQFQDAQIRLLKKGAIVVEVGGTKHRPTKNLRRAIAI